MGLRYKLISTPNKKYDKERMGYLRKTLAILKGVSNHTPKEEDDERRSIDDDVAELTGTIKNFRKKLKKLEETPVEFKQIHITSDRSWPLYRESVDDETGLTKYEPKEIFKVDVKLDYNRKPNTKIKDVVKKAQDEAIESLKDYRKQSREIPFVEKNYLPASLKDMRELINPKYKVYAGSGFGGSGGEITYKDVWRGTNITTVIPDGNNNYNIHMEGGTFLELNKLTKIRRIFEAKKPKTNANHVGIEIEFISKYDKDKLALFLMEEGVQEYVHLLNDGSLRPEKNEGYPFAHEVTILAPEQLIYVILESTLKAINRDKCSKVNQRCGIHVHLDMRFRDRKMSFHNLSKAQRIMYAMNPRQRLDGTLVDGKKDREEPDGYAKRVETTDIDAMVKSVAEQMDRGDRRARYYGINVDALKRHETLEIRIHSGSLNYDKISNWIKILCAVVNTNHYIETEAAKAETFCEYYGLDETLLAYINERIAKFKDKNGKHVTIEEVA